MVVYCPRCRIGYNTDLDPSCPQCMLKGREPPSPVAELDDISSVVSAGAPKRKER